MRGGGVFMSVSGNKPNIASCNRRQVFKYGGTVTTSAAVISKVACELRLRPDPWHSVSLLIDCLISTDETSKQFPGFVYLLFCTVKTNRQ